MDQNSIDPHISDDDQVYRQDFGTEPRGRNLVLSIVGLGVILAALNIFLGMQ